MSTKKRNGLIRERFSISADCVKTINFPIVFSNTDYTIGSLYYTAQYTSTYYLTKLTTSVSLVNGGHPGSTGFREAVFEGY